MVDADDQYDLEAKFASLKETWNTMLPGFHDWFKKKRINLFIEFINRSPLDRATLGNSFYNNWLEVLHKLQKKKIEHEVCQISKALEQWKKSYNREAARAIFEHGKYNIAPAFEHFYVKPPKWFRWNEMQEKQHITSVIQFTPKRSELYNKPKHAGLEGNGNTKPRRGHIELDLLINPLEDVFPTEAPEETQSQTKTVIPLKTRKIGNDKYAA